MKKRGAFLLLLAASTAGAQPFVFYRGVANAASFLPPGLPNSAIARGSLFSVFGRGLGPTAPQQVSAFPLQANFSGVAVEISQGSTKVSGLPVFVSAGQLNVIMPSNAPLGAVSVRVVYNSQASNPVPVSVTQSSVGIFSINSGGFGPGVVQNFVSDTNIPVNSLRATARPGQTEILWATGLGPASFGDAVAPTPVTIEPSTEVFVGGKKAAINYAGRSPCCASVDQIVFTLPQDAPSGCYVPVVVRTLNSVISNTITMAIDASGVPCADSHNPLSDQWRTGGKSALAMISRDSVHVDVKVAQPYDVVLDSLMAAFRNNSPSDFFFSALTAPPPLGTCTVYAGASDRFRSLSSPFVPPGTPVNPGSPLKVEAGASSATAASTSGSDGTFSVLLGGQNPVKDLTPPPLLNAGPFVISSPGSASSGPFRANVDGADSVSWTNRDQISTIDRAKDLTLTWSPAAGPTRGIEITGVSLRIPSNAQAGFVCMAPAGATSFTIPAYVLAALPASAGNDYVSSTLFSIGNVPFSSSVPISGFDSTLLSFSNWTSKTAVTK